MRLISFIITLFISSSVFSKSKEFTVVGHPGFYPFSYIEKGEFQGVGYEVLKLIAKKENIKINIMNVPWKRALQYCFEGKIDLLAAVIKSPKRMAHGNLSYSYGETITEILGSRPNLATRWEDLKKYKGAAVRGVDYNFGKEINFFTDSLQRVNQGEILFLLLKLKRVDYIVSEQTIRKIIIKKFNIKEKLYQYEQLRIKQDVGYMFCKGFIDQELINSGIKELKENNVIKSITKNNLKYLFNL